MKSTATTTTTTATARATATGTATTITTTTTSTQKKKLSDGWHIVCGYDAYIEDGRIVRMTKRGRDGSEVPAAPYRACRYGGWSNDTGCTVDAFRTAYLRGNMIVC